MPTPVIAAFEVARGNASPATIPVPASMEEGDTMLCLAILRSNVNDASRWGEMAGWTKQLDCATVNFSISAAVYTRIATASEPVNYTLNTTGSSGNTIGYIIRITGGNNDFTNIVPNVFKTGSGSLTSTEVVDELTTLVDETLAIGFPSQRALSVPFSNAGTGWPAAMDAENSYGAGGNNLSMAFVGKPIPTAGLSADFTCTSQASERWTSIQLMIEPAVAVDPAVLTNPTATKINETELTGTVITDLGAGTLYAWANTNNIELASAVKANGTPYAVSSAGVQNVVETGVPGAGMFIHYVQEENGDSNVVDTTPAVTMDPPLGESEVYDGSVIPFDSILHYAEGEHDGGDGAAVFVDSALSMTVDEFINLIVQNRTDSSEATITDNDATTITGILAGGTDNDWDDLDEMHTVADIANTDVMYCQSQVSVVSESAQIRWYIYDTSLDKYTVVYTQTINATGSPNGQYSVVLDPDGGITLTVVAPGVPPVLTDPTAVATGSTTSDGTVTTDESSGTLYFLASTNASESATAIKAGSSQAVSASGVQNVSVIDLIAGGELYYLHYVHTDDDGDSNVVTSVQFATEFAVATLSLPTGAAVNTTANGTVTTDVGGGTLHYSATVNATETAAAIIAAGLNKPVTAVGIQNVSQGNLLPNTAYFMHYVQVTEDDSNVVSSTTFMTGDVPASTNVMDAILITTGGPTINDGLAIWYGKTMSETLNDAEVRWLQEQGATYGPINQMWMQLLSVSYSGTLNDMQFQYWVNGGVF